MKTIWADLYRKVRFAVLAAIPIDAGYVIAALNGSTSWKVAVVGAVLTDIPLIVAWSVRETKTSA